MPEPINQLIDRLSNFFANRKGLLPILGLVLIILNGLFQFFPGLGWIAQSNLLLHIGIILAILGFMIAWAL